MPSTLIFHKIYFDAVKELSKENQLEIYNALFEYVFNGVDTELQGLSKTVFMLLKMQVGFKEESVSEIESKDEVESKEEVKNKEEVEKKDIKADKIDYKSFVEVFNNSIGAFIPKVKLLTDKRRKTIAFFLKKYSSETISEVYKICASSDFLQGKKERREGYENWRADFDFIFNEKNFAKILEGKYDNGIGNKKQIHQLREASDFSVNNTNTLGSPPTLKEKSSYN